MNPASYYVALEIEECPGSHLTLAFLGPVKSNLFPKIIDRIRVMENRLPAKIKLEDFDMYGIHRTQKVRKCKLEDPELQNLVNELYEEYDSKQWDGPNLHITLFPDNERQLASLDSVTGSIIYLKQVGSNQKTVYSTKAKS